MSADFAVYVDAVPLPALLIRDDERIVAANAEARALLGQQILGRHFITALRQPQLLDSIEAGLAGKGARDTEFLTRAGGQDMTYAVSIRPVPLPVGSGVLVAFRDVSPLEQAGQIRRDFVANVSHELRTPLTALMGFIETLQGPAARDEAARGRFLAIMQGEAARMGRLVEDLLSLSRVEADERVRPTSAVALVDILRSSLHGLGPLAKEAGVTLDAQIPEALPEVIGDADQLRQVITNLVENAIKYSGRDSSVTASLTAQDYDPRFRGPAVQLAVQDTGPGIDQLHIPRLTERFYRVDSHRSREMGGTGLGLAIVKHIVNRHRGRLRIDSEPGKGSRFTVILPAG